MKRRKFLSTLTLAASLALGGLGFPSIQANADVPPKLACQAANDQPSYQRSVNELSGRDYWPLAYQGVQGWDTASTHIQFYNTSNPDTRDVLIGALDYGSSAGFNGITMPYPACKDSYGGDWPKKFTYARLNTAVTDPMPSSRVRYIFYHELGHFLGLAHHASETCARDSVMLSSGVGYVSCGITGIQPDDVTRVNSNFP